MKILLSALGSRGDIQPYLALAVGLQRTGHQVTLAAPATATAWIQEYGVRVHPLPFNPQDFLQRPEAQAIVKSRNVLRQLRMMTETMTPGLVQALGVYWEAAQQAEFVIQTGTGAGGIEAAQVRGIPLALAYLQPFHPTGDFPSFFLPFRFSLGRGYNRFTHALMARVLWPALSTALNQWRRRLGLRPWRSLGEMINTPRQWGTPTLLGYSPSLLPKPADWAADLHVTGYWFLEPPPEWTPPNDLVRFLEAGPPPVYIGFGSMRDEDPARLTQLAVRALKLSGQRGLLLGGWGGLDQRAAGDEVFFVADAPHAWLFPRMAAVMHHGGAGTTAAGLRAGVPSLITPFALDQYAWAQTAQQAGVGPRLPALKALTAEALAAALRTAVADPGLRARAAALGEVIRAEDGVAQAVAIIEAHARQKTATH